MMLRFPNASRSFDANRSRVCFWGYDSTIEVSFFIGAEALQRLCPETENAEAGYLNAFDVSVERIHKAAERIYTDGGRGKGSHAYVLAATDF